MPVASALWPLTFEFVATVQIYVVFAGTISLVLVPPLFDGVTAAKASLEQIDRVTFAILGVGFTVIVNVSVLPEHPLTDGVTTIVEVIDALVLLAAVNTRILPVPLAAKPVAELSLVHV